jgi:hypothetical protein
MTSLFCSQPDSERHTYRTLVASGLPLTIPCCCLPGIRKLADFDGSVGKLGGDLKFSAHGLDEVLERTDVHIGVALTWMRIRRGRATQRLELSEE